MPPRGAACEVTGLPEGRLLLRLALGDRLVAREERLGALDNRHVDHPSVDGDGADAFGESLVVGGDDAGGVLDLRRARAEFLVEDLDLRGMDDAGAHEAEAARAAHRLAEGAQ